MNWTEAEKRKKAFPRNKRAKILFIPTQCFIKNISRTEKEKDIFVEGSNFILCGGVTATAKYISKLFTLKRPNKNITFWRKIDPMKSRKRKSVIFALDIGSMNCSYCWCFYVNQDNKQTKKKQRRKKSGNTGGKI